MEVRSWRLTAVVVLACVRVASADPAAEQLFRDGRQLLKDGQVDAACERFAASEAQEPRVGTLLNLAECRATQGKIATAWELFVEAQALATRVHDDRAALAAKRAAELAPRRAQLTISVAAPVPGLVVSREGVELLPATWGVALPTDPGTITIAAAAPGHRGASFKVVVPAEGRATATVPALEVDATAVSMRTAASSSQRVVVVPAATHVVSPPIRMLSVGLAIGGDSDSDFIYGVRLTGSLPLGPGAFRAVLSGLYTTYQNDPTDPYNTSKLYAVGVGLDYVFAWAPHFASAAGVGFGVDVEDPAYDVVNTNSTLAGRLSPIIVRFARPQLELGVHAQLVTPANVLVYTFGVDWFFR